MTITKLISQDKLKEAIKLLPDSNEKFMLQSRLSRLDNDAMIGTISRGEEVRERNQIRNSLLYYAGIDPETIPKPQRRASLSGVPGKKLSDQIGEFYQKHKRTELGEEIKELHTAVSDYESMKSLNPHHDRRGRQLQGLKSMFESLQSRASEKKEDGIDHVIGKVEKLLDTGTKSDVLQAVEHLATLMPNSSKLKSLKARVVEYGHNPIHLGAVIGELDGLLGSL